MAIDEMRPEEVFATNPVVPNDTPSDAKIARGFIGGASDRPFFNYLWQRYSELIFKTQTEALGQKTRSLRALTVLDDNTIFVDSFKGEVGDDLMDRTPPEGNALRNDSGLGLGRYLIGTDSSVKRTLAFLFPVYTDCEQDSSNLVFELKLNYTYDYALSSYGDKVGVVMNCTGAYQRTEVSLVALPYGGISPKVITYNTSGDEINSVSFPGISLLAIDNRELTLVVRASTSQTIVISIPELNYTEDTGISMTVGTATNDHGFIATPQSFTVKKLTIYTQ